MMTCAYMLRRGCLYNLDRTALIFDDQMMTYQELYDSAKRLANGLYSLGLKTGDRIAHIDYNCFQTAQTIVADAIGGFVRVHLLARSSPEEFAYMIDNCQASAVIIGEQFVDSISSIKDNLKYKPKIIAYRDPGPGMIDYERLISKSLNEELNVEIHEDDVYIMRHTAGTTGRPTPCYFSNKNWIAQMTAFMFIFGPANPGDVCMAAGAMSHAAGYFTWWHIAGGGTTVIRDNSSGFDPARFCDLLEKYKVKLISTVVPTQLYMILDYLKRPETRTYDFSHLQDFNYGAAPMSVERLKEAIEFFGPIFTQTYGATESGGVALTLRKWDHKIEGTEQEVRRLGSAGREVLNTAYRIVNEKGEDVKPGGEIGEVLLASDSNMIGFWNDPESTKERMEGRWLHTNDMGWMDEEGYVHLVDRKQDMIVSGGYNVYPNEVEQVIYSHPAVLECAVIGIPDENWGEQVKAVIRLKEGYSCTEEEIEQTCIDHLGRWKRPKSVDFTREPLPKNEIGKILRRKLKEPYWKDRGRLV